MKKIIAYCLLLFLVACSTRKTDIMLSCQKGIDKGMPCCWVEIVRDSSYLKDTVSGGLGHLPVFYTSYTPKFFEQLLIANPAIQLVDVRTEKEYDAGFIRNAQLIDVRKEDFLQRVDSLLDKSRPVAVYCKGGVRSRKAALLLVEKGFIVYNLDKGYDSWIEADKKKALLHR